MPVKSAGHPEKSPRHISDGGRHPRDSRGASGPAYTWGLADPEEAAKASNAGFMISTPPPGHGSRRAGLFFRAPPQARTERGPATSQIKKPINGSNSTKSTQSTFPPVDAAEPTIDTMAQTFRIRMMIPPIPLISSMVRLLVPDHSHRSGAASGRDPAYGATRMRGPAV